MIVSESFPPFFDNCSQCSKDLKRTAVSKLERDVRERRLGNRARLLLASPANDLSTHWVHWVNSRCASMRYETTEHAVELALQKLRKSRGVSSELGSRR